MKKRLRIAIPVLLLGALATWAALRDASGATDALTASGTVEATDADLGFQVAGRVLEIGPREGDVVSAGEELARLDTRELDAARAAAAAQVAAAEARLAELLSGSRIEALSLDAGAGEQRDFLRAQAGLFQARAGYARARHDAVLARVNLALARGSLNRAWMDRALEVGS